MFITWQIFWINITCV